jgi:uncharacterized protein
MDSNLIFLLLSLSAVAFLYSSVGHGGASGYLAIMALVGIAPALMKSSALVMNLAVSLKILAVCILLSIFRMIYQFRQQDKPNRPIPVWAGLLSGGIIGLLSGMLGIGGGIILSPLMLLMGWAKLKETAAVSALFIFVNSLSGLYGQMQKGGIHLTENLQWAVLATIMGGLLGSYYGSQKFNIPTLRYMLAAGLGIACLKLIFT